MLFIQIFKLIFSNSLLFKILTSEITNDCLEISSGIILKLSIKLII